MLKRGWPLLAAALCLSGAPAQAQTAAAPAGRDEGDPSKFFWFNKSGADPATARTDIEYCVIQTSAMAGRVQQNPGASMGLIGALVGGIMNGITQGVESRRMRDAGLRKCMVLYGYQRYRVPEPAWNEMMRADDSVERLVAFTTGPQPATERLDP